MANIIKFPLDQLQLQDLELTNDEKDRIVLTLQGKALKNPVQPSITLLKTELSNQITQFQTSKGLLNIPSLTLNQIQNIITRLNQVSLALTRYETHSNILSGVTLNYNGFPPSFIGRLSIAQTYNKIKESLRKKQDGPCGVEESKTEIFSEVFYSILGHAQTEIDDVYNIILNLNERWQSDNTISYSSIINRLNLAKTNLDGFKTKDNNGFYKAYNFVVKISTAQSLVNSKNDDFSKKLFDAVNGTPLFNSDNLDPLKIQCQVWGNDSNPPPSDFADNFQGEFALSSIADLIDTDIGITSDNYVLQFISGSLTSVSLASLGICLDDLCNVSGASGALNNQALVYNSSSGYFEPQFISGGGSGSSTFVGLNDTPGSITANQFVVGNGAGNALVFTTIDTNDISGLSTVATTGDYNDLINTPSLTSFTTVGADISIFNNDSGFITAGLQNGDVFLASVGVGITVGLGFFGHENTGFTFNPSGFPTLYQYVEGITYCNIFKKGSSISSTLTTSTLTLTNPIFILNSTTSSTINTPSLEVLNTDSGSVGQIDLYDASANTDFKVSLKSAFDVPDDSEFVFPAIGATDGQILTYKSALSGTTWAHPKDVGITLYGVKTADQTKNSDNTLADDSEMSIPVEANSIYEFRAFLVTNSHATPDMKILFSSPAGATLNLFLSASNNGALIDPSSVTVLAGSGANRAGYWRGSLVTSSTAGNFVLQWAQKTSDVNDTILRKGSYIALTKMA